MRSTTLVTLVAAAAAALLGLPAVAAADTVARASAPGTAPVRSDAPIDFVGVKWRGSSGEGAIRFQPAAGAAWDDWQPVHHGDVAPREGGDASALIPAGGAVAYQLRRPAGSHDVRAVALTTPEVRTARMASEAGRRPGHCFYRRADWGADESLRFDPDGSEIWPPAYFPVQRLTVHHTATDTTAQPDPKAMVQAIYAYHAQFLGWGDIGYQLLIDATGCVYEGRWSGDDVRPVYAGRSAGPAATPLAVNGAHSAGYNAGNVGVAMLGDFTTAEPARAARAALVRTLGIHARVNRLDPLGAGTYVNPISGATKDTAVIAAHRDWLATECPGERLYADLPAIRMDVARWVLRH
jgi:hypothetical protein